MRSDLTKLVAAACASLLADANTLRQLERLLGGRVFLFAVWVN